MSYTQGMKMSTMTILMNARVLYYTYDRGWMLFKSGLYMLLTIYKCSFNDAYIFSLVFSSLKMYVYYLEHKIKLLYRGFLHYVANTCDSWFQWKAHSLGIQAYPYEKNQLHLLVT